MNLDDFKKIYGEYKPIYLNDKDINIINKIYIKSNSQEEDKISEPICLSIENAILDVEDLFVTLKYCYSGYEYFNQIIDFNIIKDTIINKLKNYKIDSINASKLAEIIADELKKYINDGHLSFQVGESYYQFYKPYYAYVTGIIVEEQDNCYRVVKGNKKVAIDTIFSKDALYGKLLPTLTILSDKKCYLIGVHSNEKIKSLSIDGVNLKTRLLYAYQYEYVSPDYILKFDECKTYNLLQSKKYVIYENYQEYLKQFYELGVKSRNKKTVIFDIAGNPGGWSAYPEKFIKGLNEYSYWKTDVAIIQNDVFENTNNQKNYEVIYSDNYQTDKGKYEGTLYVVINKWTASSGEAAIEYAKSCKNVIFVGSDSAGVGLFGDIRRYILTRSKIGLYIPYKVFYEDGKEEGKGFLPDYWIDSKNPTTYLKKWLKHNNII